MPNLNAPILVPDPAAADESTLLVGAWHVNFTTRSTTNGCKVHRLSPRAAKLLEVLVHANGQGVARETLMQAVWPNVVVGDESLTQAVAELRRVFGTKGTGKRVIETIPKYGYRLCAPVTRTAIGDRAPLREATDTFDLEAYQLCLDARRALSRGGPGAVLEPERLTGMAVARAPQFALAHAEYAIALSYRWLYQRSDDATLEQAQVHADTALRLRPDMSTSHGAIAFAHGALGQADKARSALAMGLQCDRHDADLHFLGARMLLAMRDYRCATSLAEEAARLDGDDFRPLFFAARTAHVFDPVRGRRNALACLDRLRAHLAIDPSEPRALNTLGPIYSLLGEHDQAYAAVEAQRGCRSPCLFYDVIALSEIGDLDGASNVFEEVVDLGWRHSAWFMAEPVLAPLQAHRRFRKTTRALGLL